MLQHTCNIMYSLSKELTAFCAGHTLVGHLIQHSIEGALAPCHTLQAADGLGFSASPGTCTSTRLKQLTLNRTRFCMADSSR